MSADRVEIVVSDVFDGLAGMADDSVDCVVTSPPYWGLREYGFPGQIGREPTLAEHIAVMVRVFSEVRRVLKPTGNLWMNYGDAMRDKQLLMLPARVAMALQGAGWWLRSEIVIAKLNPMPESATDRPTNAHEKVFLLTKAPRYFYDAEAVREKHFDKDGRGQNRGNIGANGGNGGTGSPDGLARGLIRHAPGGREYNPAGRNSRNVWTIATEPTSFAHFATMPTEIARRCIAAGSSERGVCAECGKPWVREVAAAFEPQADVSRERGVKGAAGQKPMDASSGWDGFPRGSTRRVTLGWSASCACDAATVPALVLDPFGGAATTGLVAARLGRRAVLIEANPDYAEIGRKRVLADWSGPDARRAMMTEQDSAPLPLFAEVGA